LLVRTEYSLISVGTEMMKVSEAKLSLLGKARARPDQARKVLANVAKEGPKATFDKVMNRLESYTPLGYSLAGVVVEVGLGVIGYRVGQRVACAGNQFALHAELNWVPANLCVPVPDAVDPRHAAFSAVGAIAMQGLRQAELGLGDICIVIGLGLVGQLLVRLLVASGARVIGVDLSDERCRLAEGAGALRTGSPEGAGLESVAAELAAVSDGHGADAVFIAAGGQSNQPVELAAELARDRGRVIDIGKCSLDLPWNAYYEKELDVCFSRSYGPGRYDPLYEEGGVDYPIGYVRWTEGRNLACFVDLLARKQIDIEPLVSSVVDFADAVGTYEAIDAGRLKGIGFLFEFAKAEATRSVGRAVPPRSPMRPEGPAIGALRIGFIGAGNYASSMLLPHLIKRDDVELAAVATRTSLSAANAQRKFGFAEAHGDHRAVLADPSIDAVFVVTRHRSHAGLVCEALRAGKAVFVEKPLAITLKQLQEVVESVDETGNDRLAVGFNRRFAPLLSALRAEVGSIGPGGMLRYLVNAGTLDAGSWYLDADAEGTRFAGEGGHFIDTCSWWLGATPVRVQAVSAGRPDDVQVTLEYDDGSVAAVTYTTSGARRFPKETFEAVAGGTVARLDNFMRASVWNGTQRKRLRPAITPNKGQAAQVGAFIDSVRSRAPMPIPFDSLVATTAATLAVGSSLATGQPMAINEAV
jgi:predicted dehydrogenase/threonine dehydrogenase-like Zn-dependent dehydrogenase